MSHFFAPLRPFDLGLLACLVVALVSIWCANHAEALQNTDADGRDWHYVLPPATPSGE